MRMIHKVAILAFIALIPACATPPTPPTIATLTDEESLTYENKYLNEYEAQRKNYVDNKKIKWFQPANKKEPCKVFVGTSKDDDRTEKEDYKIFWDGSCENGYAKGLGREIEKGALIDTEAIGIYQGGEIKPRYYIQKDHLNNTTLEGDLNNSFAVQTTISDKNFDFNIEYLYGFNGSQETLVQPSLLIINSPFSDNATYVKAYPNFSYVILENSNNEFQDINYEFCLRDKNGSRNGFGFQIKKNGSIYSAELINEQKVRFVNLPESYLTKFKNIFSEIEKAGEKANEAQTEALKVKKQYVKRICNESVKVSFMDNDEYKAICKEEEYYTQLKEKIEKKFSQMNQQKQQQREQLYEQQRANALQQQQIRQQNQQMQQEGINDMVNALGQMGDTMRQAGNQAIQQSNSFVPPTVQPMNIHSLRDGNRINCFTTGGITTCR